MLIHSLFKIFLVHFRLFFVIYIYHNCSEYDSCLFFLNNWNARICHKKASTLTAPSNMSTINLSLVQYSISWLTGLGMSLCVIVNVNPSQSYLGCIKYTYGRVSITHFPKSITGVDGIISVVAFRSLNRHR